jgi:hypothetical protein
VPSGKHAILIFCTSVNIFLRVHVEGKLLLQLLTFLLH